MQLNDQVRLSGAMLPDYPDLKRRVEKRLRYRLRAEQAEHAGPLGEIPSGRLHEGVALTLVRTDGSSHTSTAKNHRVTVSFSNEELETMSLEELHRKCSTASQEMAQLTGQTFFEAVDEAVKEVGNVTNFSQLTGDALLEMLERVDIDFKDGKPIMPTLFIPESRRDEAERVFHELESDSIAHSRLANIITLKREEWRDREASRKLVE